MPAPDRVAIANSISTRKTAKEGNNEIQKTNELNAKFAITNPNIRNPTRLQR